jgi:hypothetical protein
MIPYQWIFHLRTADDSQPFLSNDHIESMGYVTGARLDLPERPPVGFAKTIDPNTKEAWLGFNCAACHTNYILSGDQTVFVDGAPSMANLERFSANLAASLEATTKPGRFEKFASALLGSDANPAAIAKVRVELLDVAAMWAQYQVRMAHDVTYGFGRLDAVGAIYNDVLEKDLRVAKNRKKPNAPVSYPYLWQSAQAGWIQWNGDSYNHVRFLSILRSIVEQLGVFARVEISESGNVYSSSMLLEQTDRFLDLLEKLRPPAWPVGILPPVDLQLAANGRDVYQKHCLDCHQLISRDQLDKTFDTRLEPTFNVDTDLQAAAAAIRTADSGVLAGKRIYPVIGPRIQEKESALSITTHIALGVAREHFAEVYLKHLNYDNIKAFITYVTYNGLDLVQPKLQYKTGPLNGVWATAPYLHNGSVPNLRQLFLPVSERETKFYSGCRVYDPVNLGYMQPELDPISDKKMLPVSQDCSSDTARNSLLDTSIAGNLNTGHEYGLDIYEGEGKGMTDDDIVALLEFLKTL